MLRSCMSWICVMCHAVAHSASFNCVNNCVSQEAYEGDSMKYGCHTCLVQYSDIITIHLFFIFYNTTRQGLLSLLTQSCVRHCRFVCNGNYTLDTKSHFDYVLFCANHAYGCYHLIHMWLIFMYCVIFTWCAKVKTRIWRNPPSSKTVHLVYKAIID